MAENETTAPAATAPAATAPALLDGENTAPAEGGDPTPADAPAADAPAADAVPDTYTFELPEGVTLDAEALGQVSPIFKELGLTQGQAQKLIDFEAQREVNRAQAQQANFETLVKDWQKQSLNDKEFGGDKFEENVATANLAMKKFGNDALVKLMADHAVGNHPEMIRFMLNVGKTLKEDVPGSNGGNPAGKLSAIDILYPTKEK